VYATRYDVDGAVALLLLRLSDGKHVDGCCAVAQIESLSKRIDLSGSKDQGIG
jgi:hypothetical protein